MTNAELAAVFRLMAGMVDNLGSVPQPSEPAAAGPAQPETSTAPATAGLATLPLETNHQNDAKPKASPASPSPSPEVPIQPKPVINLDTIKGVQQALNQLRAANFPKLEENGIHDAVMIWDLKTFQATTGIPTTGEVDKITIDTLHKIIFGVART